MIKVTRFKAYDDSEMWERFRIKIYGDSTYLYRNQVEELIDKLTEKLKQKEYDEWEE